MRRTVADVMTRDVLTVRESTPFKEVAWFMRARGVSALPVLGADDAVVGIVSESDLMLKEEGLAAAMPPLFERRRRRRERAKATGTMAGELMTAPAITVSATAPLAEAARTMHQREVKRLPVVDERGRLVGIVSRADLIKVYLRSDEEIRAEVRDALALPLRIHPDAVTASVRNGVVRLVGLVTKRSEIALAEDFVQHIDGVVAVESQLDFEVDDAWPVPPLIGP
jgi:CBS domain-containing protein